MYKTYFAVFGVLCAACADAAPAKKAKFDIEAETRKVVAMETGKTLGKSKVTREELARMVAAVPSKPRPDVRSLPRTGRHESWVENGYLVLNGSPIIRRNMYAPRYMCSKAFNEQIESDNIFDTPEFTQCGIEFGRLVPGSEAREGKKHQKPSREVFDAIAKRMDSMKDKDFAYYYLCDEPECRSISPVYLKWLYEFVKERDPYHAVFICSRDAVKYIECADCIEVHPYINPFIGSDGKRHYGTPINTFGNYIEEVVAMNRKDKVIGCTPTAFAYTDKGFHHLYPTFDEYVSSVWAILVGGGKSIHPFLSRDMGARPSIYEGVKYVFSSVKALEEMLLLGSRRRIERTDEYEAAEWELNGEKMFAAVNLREKKLNDVRLKGVKGRFIEFRGSRTFDADEIVLDLNPFEVIVATTKKMDAGYETLAQVKARERRLEYERTHRDNRILGKASELQFAASKPLGLQSKIADGMLVQQAELFRGGNPWYEIAFPKEPIIFREIHVYGENLERTTVKVRRHGKWIDLKPVSNSYESYKLSLAFGEEVHTSRVRFEFHKDMANLYEIEFPKLKERSTVSTPSPVKRVVAKGHSLKGQSCFVLDASNAVCTNRWSGTMWYGKNINTRALDDGGFVVGPSGGTHALKLDPKWKWADFEIYKDAVHPDERAYRNWAVVILGHQSLSGSTYSCPTGIYTIPLKPIEKEKHSYVQVKNINMDVPFKYIRLCEEPPRRLEVTSPVAATNGCITAGDMLRFKLVLDEPCEDVILTYYTFNNDGTGPIPFSLDGKSGVELECADGKGLVWTADVKVKKSLKPRKAAIYAKAVTLGGRKSLTIRTRFPQY